MPDRTRVEEILDLVAEVSALSKISLVAMERLIELGCDFNFLTGCRGAINAVLTSLAFSLPPDVPFVVQSPNGKQQIVVTSEPAEASIVMPASQDSKDPKKEN